MANSSIVSTSTTTDPSQLPIPLIHLYPPTLADRQNLPASSTMHIDITICNSSGILATQIVGQLVIPIREHEQEEEEEHPTSGFESPNSQNEQPVMTALSIENSDHDSSILLEIPIGGEDQAIDLRLTELNGCSDPKDVAYLLRAYPLFMGLVVGKFIWGKHTPFPSTNPFMIISVVVFAMAYLNLLILSCIYDGLKTLPRQLFSPGHYKISKYTFYLLCFLAPFFLLPLLFIPKD